MVGRTVRAAAMLVAAALAFPVGALAHGDPTAHYLETDALLTTYAAPPDVGVELQLRGVLDAAATRGYPIKVALIASDDDTGGDPTPLEDVQGYAKLVGEQLSSVKALKAPVLIVTPRQIGVGGTQRAPARDLPLARRPDGNALARSAMRAIRILAAREGHALPERIPPAKNNLTGILKAASTGNQPAVHGPWLIAGVTVATILFALLAVVAHRRLMRVTA